MIYLTLKLKSKAIYRPIVRTLRLHRRLRSLTPIFSCRYILNYLRNGELVCPDDEAVKRQLLLEAEFYQIQAIIKRLSPPVQTFSTLSVILNEDNHQDILLDWLPPNVATQQLLYRASRDGRRVKDFHHYCDGKGPTLVLMKHGDYIFGGYTEKSWRSRKYSVYRLKYDLIK